jgi:hypothetical protein
VSAGFLALASLRGGTARGTGGRADESNPRARSDNERPRGRPAPGVRLIRGLNRTKKETDVTGGTAAAPGRGGAQRSRLDLNMGQFGNAVLDKCADAGTDS